LLRLRFFIPIFLLSELASAQISPPGLDDTNVVLWGAVGFNQQLGQKWSVTAYVGGSRESNPNNLSVLHKQAIFVVNQETQYQFNSHWQLSFCSSLRFQNIYKEDAPYLSDDPDLRNEIRYYLRLYYRQTVGKIGLTYSFRPEYRGFYEPDWSTWASRPVELRFRLKIQANVPLNSSKTNQFIIGNEWLSVTDDKRNSEGNLYWSTYAFTEDRVTTYFRHVFKKPSLIVDVGYMHQILVQQGKIGYIGHFAFDLIFQNPFGKPSVTK